MCDVDKNNEKLKYLCPILLFYSLLSPLSGVFSIHADVCVCVFESMFEPMTSRSYLFCDCATRSIQSTCLKLCANEEKHEFNWAKERRVWYVCIESVRESLCWSNRAIPKLGFVSNGRRRRRRPCKNQVLFRWVPYLPFRQHLNFKLCRRCYSETIHKHTHTLTRTRTWRTNTHTHTHIPSLISCFCPA